MPPVPLLSPLSIRDAAGRRIVRECGIGDGEGAGTSAVVAVVDRSADEKGSGLDWPKMSNC